MQKRKFLPFLGTVCLLLNLMLPILKTDVYANDKNEVTLNFIGGTLKEGKVFYYGGENNNYISQIELAEKNTDPSETYSNIDISENNMKINLNEKDYYLKVVPKVLIENPDEILGTTGSPYFNKLYINEKSFDITSNYYIKLGTAEFSGNLNVRLENEPSGPPRPSYPDNISIEATFDGFGMEVYLNSERVGAESTRIAGIGKGYASGEINNLIRVQLAFGSGYIGSITVNGDKINIPENREYFEFTVKPANKYNIDVKKADNSSEAVPRTIIWSSDKANNSSLNDDEILKNGTIEILDVKDSNGNSIGLENVKQDTENNNGWASILPGSKVILKLKPNYGYQLTSIKINDETLVAGEEESTFEYIMPDTNVHLSGIFEKVDDKVKTESKKIKEGNIVIDGSEINTGSVILSVDDVTLSEQQISNFKEKANGYEISSYLNIRLNHVLYKGTSDNVWSKELTDLKNQATITLKLEEEVKGNEIMIVHEKHDGTYEIIPTTYDASTNTITFKTSSFSNYALASKSKNVVNEVSESNSNNEYAEVIPQTGDSIVKYILIFALAVVAVIIFVMFNRRKATK